MTVQALAWAIDQQVPGNAGRVLIALGNHADHTNGFVHLDTVTIAREACVTTRSLWRYLGALERNGFLAKDNHRTSADKRDYWLQMDRDPAVPWTWAADEQRPEADDSDDGAAGPESATAPASPVGTFSRAKQAEERKAAEVLPSDRPVGMVPVIEGSEAWRAWCVRLREERKMIPYVRSIVLQDGNVVRGFYMPTLFPPRVEDLDMDGAA